MQATGLNQIKRFPYTDILGWSVSRFDKFQTCKRQYYYDYYAKHDREFPKKKIESLKKMTSIPLEIGNIFHDTVKILLERLLVSEKPVNNEKFLDHIRKMTEQYCEVKIFREVYYKEKEKIETDKIFENLKNIANNFIESRRYQWILKEAVSNKTGWIIEPPGYGETRINGIKAYCKVDFLFPVKEKLYIMDWKTGKPDERKHKKQLVGYATWAYFHFEKNPENIYPVIVYLQPSFSEMEISVKEKEIQEFSETVKKDTEELHSFCKDIGLNIPKEKEEFKKTDNLSICKFCNYRELCQR